MRKVKHPKTEKSKKTPVPIEKRASADAGASGFEPVNVGYSGASRAETIDSIDDAREKRHPRMLKKNIVPMDAPFFTLVIILLAFGLVMLYSASYAKSYNDYKGDSTHIIMRQLMLAAAGFAAMIIMAFTDYHILQRFSLLFFAGSMVLLFLTPFVGTNINGSTRWIYIGEFGFQPSELAKLGLILFFAYYVEKIGDKMKKPLYSYGLFVIIAGMLYIMLSMQPHISAFLLMAATCAILTFIGGASKKWGALFVGGGALAGGTLFGVLSAAGVINFAEQFAYIVKRIEAWRDPFLDPRVTGFQPLQSLYAIGSGGLFGLGLGNSRQKQLFLPEMHNDYIFSIVCEELGFIGAMIVLILFAALILRGFWIALHARDKFGCMLVAGIMTIYTLQIVLNIAVVTNTIPPTGMSLPFFSYGGTALGLLLFQMGIVLSVSRQIPAPKQG